MVAGEESPPVPEGQAVEGACAAGAAPSPSEGEPSGVGPAKAPSTNRVAMPEVGRLMAGATASLDCAQGGRAGVMLGSSMALRHAQGSVDQLVFDQLDSDLSMAQAVAKQIHQKSSTIIYVLQEKQAAERAREDLYMKNKEMSLEMERLKRENMEFSLKNKELTSGMERLKRENMEFSLKNKELTLEIENCKKKVQTSSLSNGQEHEGQEGLFDPDQQERVIFENHERQIELTEIRKRLKDVFTNMGCNDDDDPIIGIKRLGQINEKPFFHALCSNVKAAKKCSAWQKKIESHTWRPLKRITEKGHSEVILDEEDKTLKKLKACGAGIYDAVVEALMEMEKYNSSGRTVVPELWNFKEGRMATTVECIEILGREVMEPKQDCNKRRRISPRFR